MAITQYYVDPSINANSGTGTIGDPFGDLQYALNTVTQDTSNGDQFNIKSGAAEVLAGTLDFTTYGTPSNVAPLCFAGYTSSLNDGGVGIIDGNGLYKVMTMPNYCYARDLEIRNSGTNQLISGSHVWSALIRCTLHGVTSGSYGIYGGRLIGCHIYDIGSTYALGAVNLFGCGIFQGPTNTAANLAYLFDSYQFVNNLFVNTVDSGNAISGHNQIRFNCIGNSILVNGGNGINMTGGSQGGTVINNLVEGAGTGILTVGDSVVAGNAVYNSSTADYNQNGQDVLFADNESLSASPFEKTGAATWANAKAYFAPADVGNVRTGAYSSIDGVKGAIGVQATAGGGGAVLHPLRSN